MKKIIAGKYEVIKKLGDGSSGAVYLVKHPDLSVHYALKVLHQAAPDKEKIVQQLKKEAEILLSFSHPGCVQLRDFGAIEEGGYYMATDFCSGLPLDEIMEKRGILDVQETLEILIDILSVLDAAHQSGIVHRDIKPSNIIVDEQEGNRIVKVLDFGIAQLSARWTTQAALTDPNEGTAGTPCYMSPEQAYGDTSIDSRTDIYSTGILAYEMLTGKKPFDGESYIQILIAHITRPPESFDESLNIPPEVEALIMKALAKNREQRFKTARDFEICCIEALETLSRSSAEQSEQIVIEKTQILPSEEIFNEDEIEIDLEAVEEETAEQQRRHKILVIDDDPVILNLIEHILKRESYDVFTSLTFTEIYEYLFTEKVSLIITDVMMPGLPGSKICRLIKEQIHEIDIILFSSIPENELRKLSEQSNADGWISKSSKPSRWIEIVNEIINQGNKQ